jgi:hypothetical protein
MDEISNARKLILIGTDHRLQHSVAQGVATGTWIPRKGEQFHRLVVHCIDRLGAVAILEEAHAEQDRIAPTICSGIAKERNLPWQPISLGQPDVFDGLYDPPLGDAFLLCGKPDILAGRYDLNTQTVRESFMREAIAQCVERHACVLAVVGYVHLGVLAQMFMSEGVRVEALLFTSPLIVDESRA